jgi:hypothetical protein
MFDMCALSKMLQKYKDDLLRDVLLLSLPKRKTSVRKSIGPNAITTRGE